MVQVTFCLFPIRNPRTKPGHNLHDTEKPVELMKVLIENSSQISDIVFEPFAGIGATCIAAKQSNRRYIGVELDKKYFDISVERLKSI